MLENTDFVVQEGTVTIFAQAFEGQMGLRKITIPASVNQIYTAAFKDAANLEEVNFLSNSELDSIPINIFEGCSSLITINLPNTIKNISDYAFKNCNSLNTISLPELLTNIPMSMFEGC